MLKKLLEDGPLPKYEKAMEKLNAKGLVGLGQKRSQIKARELVAHSNLVGVNNMKNTHIKKIP